MHPRILVAEDEAEIRDILTRLLEARGYSVTAAERGDEALELGRSGVFDLVMLDVHMPGLTGTQVLKGLRENSATRFTPIILVTGVSAAEAQVEALCLGADDYVLKPFTLEQVAVRVGRLLAGAAPRMIPPPPTPTPLPRLYAGRGGA